MSDVRETTWDFVVDEIERAVSDIAATLSSGIEADAAVPGLTWNVGELAGHLVSLPRLYRRMFEEGPLPLPENVPAMNAELIADLSPQSLDARAEQFTAEMTALLGLYGDGSSPIPHWVRERPAVETGGVLLGELITHGVDLDRAAGRRESLSAEVAIACLGGLYPAAADFVDPAAARRAEGTFHTKLRGGGDWTQRVEGGGLAVSRGLHGRPDLTINADPIALLLVSQGRLGQVRANLTGAIVAYGRKPWKGLALSKIFIDL